MFCSNCGKKLIGEVNFCPECGYPTKINQKANKQLNSSQNKKLPKNITNIICGIIAFIFFLTIFGNISPETSSPREPQNLECVKHKNLCIATTDVKYDYTSVKTRTPGYPAYNKEWNNGWAAAKNACKAWGGRLPYMEDFATIVDAYNQNKIKLPDYKVYLSNTEINAYRIYAYSHDSNNRGYNSKTIYNTAISIPKSGDRVITENYQTNTAYTWSARCVKDIK